MSGPAETLVPSELDGERTDRVVAALFELTRSEARRLVESGEVTVEGRVAVAAERLAVGMRVAARLPEAPSHLVSQPVPFDVVWEDPDVLVVSKPAGIVVHPGAGVAKPTLVAGLVERYPELAGLADHRWGLVHRLDRDTSGVLLVARTATARERLQGELRRRRITRTYAALVAGTPAAVRGTVDAPIGRDPRSPTRMAVIGEGRPARTHYRRLAAWRDAALLEVTLETGRTHQIRVHLASIGLPVVGDRTYGPRGRRHRADPGRQWLHALRLEAAHPTSLGVRIVAEAPPPGELTAAIASLGPPDVGELPEWLARTSPPQPS